MERRDRERERSQRANVNERGAGDFDSRTPLAWQHRDFNYQHQSTFNERYPEGVASSNSDRFSHPSLGSARSGPRRDKSESSEMSARGAGGTSKTNSSTAGGKGNRKGSAAGAGAGQPSSGETTTESTSETETDSHPDRQPPSRPGTSGTLRSMQSVPIMTPLQGPFSPLMGGIYGVGMVGMMPPNTWNGEPCPVHGASLHPHHPQYPQHHPMAMAAYPAYPPMYSSMSMRRAASIQEMAIPALMPPPPQAIYSHTAQHPDPRQLMVMGPPSLLAPASSLGGHGRMPRMYPPRSGAASLPPMPPSSLLPPMQRRHLVVNGKNGHPEALPVRDAPPLPTKIPPSDAASKAASKSSSKPFSYNSCCQGNVVVLWVILAIIAFGIVMAVVFSFAFQ